MPSPAPATGILRPSSIPRTQLLLAVVAIIVITVVGFVLKATHPDLAAARALNELHVGGLGSISSAIYHVFSPIEAILGTAVITLIIGLRTRSLRVAAAFAGLVAITWLSSDAVKELVHRPRPPAALLAHPFLPTPTDPSYPSGHVVFVTALAIAVIYVVRDTRYRALAIVCGAVLVALVGFAVTVDAVHYPSDAIASVVWSLTVAPAARFVWVDVLMPRIPGLRSAAGSAGRGGDSASRD